MRILDIVYPYFTLEFCGFTFEVRETTLGCGHYYEPTNPQRDKTALWMLSENYAAVEIQTKILTTIKQFESEMDAILSEHDSAIAEYQDGTYSTRYIMHMEGH
jgi:hypothetical protein